MALSTPVYFILLLACLAVAKDSLHPLSDEFISLINSKQSSWKAGRNFPLNTPLAHINKLLGLIGKPLLPSLPEKIYDASQIAGLPENFDPREKWPNCPTFYEIRDQGSCGSCWAFGAVEAMTDRVCTYSNGTKHFYFSADDLMTCCTNCGEGCHGATDLRLAWEYWRDVGIVSGGPYKSGQGCRSYEIAPCEHGGVEGKRPACKGNEKTPACVTKCEDVYHVEYHQDKHYGKHIYSIKGEDNIRMELYNNGPVEAGFLVYADFLHYKSGVYSYTHGSKLNGHAIKILGWGVEDGIKYWLCANSWNSDWGDKGLFKILRGENECGIEGEIVAGEPKLDKY